MKIKDKLTLGIAFLFIEFLIITLFGAYSIYSISQQTEKIMKDNNLSIQYAEDMLQTIDRINSVHLAVLFNPSRPSRESELAGLYEIFEESLKKEANNITEPGEKELLQALSDEYKSYKVPVAQIVAVKDKSDFYFQNLLTKHLALKTRIHHISDLNLQAIMKKNENVNQYERRSYVILTVIASICFLLSIIFIFNFPGMISDPIRQLSEGLKEVAQGNYDIRMDFTSNSEFSEMGNAVKMIADRLRQSDSSKMEAALHAREDIAGTIEKTLERLRASHEQIRNMDIKRIIDDQSSLIEILQAELEQAKRRMTQT
jgi:two-component system, NtrC family, sensor histidine kinase KinB